MFCAVINCDSVLTIPVKPLRLHPHAPSSAREVQTVFLQARAEASENSAPRKAARSSIPAQPPSFALHSAAGPCASAARRRMFGLAALLSGGVWAAVKSRCTRVENPGSRQPGLCYRSCPQWEGIDVYSVCFSMECCLSAIYIQHRLFCCCGGGSGLSAQSVFCGHIYRLNGSADVRLEKTHS